MGFVVTGCFFTSAYQQSLFTQVGLLFCGIQPIISACIAMTKDDIRKYTVKLVSLSYIHTTQPSETEEETRTETNNIPM